MAIRVSTDLGNVGDVFWTVTFCSQTTAVTLNHFVISKSCFCMLFLTVKNNEKLKYVILYYHILATTLTKIKAVNYTEEYVYFYTSLGIGPINGFLKG